MNVLKLLDELEDIIDSSSSIPFAGKTFVDKDEILEIIKEIRLQLPDEVKQAVWIKEERQKILIEAQHEADNIIDDAKDHIEQMVEKDEVTKEAQKRAEEIIAQAQESAKEMRIGARQYTDELLHNMESQLESMLGVIKENRNELKGMR
ncbi:MAG: ATPase [Anaeromicrobium sp.]|jgi:vacuolar-type H+-ATPase subunit H|uniref:ATPase n=1 Tax=Anaeromicrobium sp. TaxID=1929132 RepID=UPI0025E79E0D|nr:ATPase [Anaeromicrobium sp.]MCT4594885.1 ATPase [Anaeromicrobium sp.]